MYAAHFAAGLALKGRAPKVPMALLLIAVFVFDLLWITFAVLGLDRTPWSDWSHSLLVAFVWSSVVCMIVWRLGRRSCVIVWIAVFSHFVLDLLVQGATLYPYARRAWLIQPLVVENARILQIGLCVILVGSTFTIRIAPPFLLGDSCS